MKATSSLYFLIALSFLTACSGGEDGATHVLKKSQDAMQEKADAFIQPRIQAIEKAKSLEDKLRMIEDKRLQDLQGFEAGGQ